MVLDKAIKASKKLPKIDLDSYSTKPDDDDNENEENLEEDNDDIIDDQSSVLGSPMNVLPLFSKLDPKEQKKVFQSSPKGHRLCVIATNVAETSLTIPGIKYVVDTGKMKIR